ncbi:MAG: UvrB/UvrC motif-containing protein [Clostridia bacterium]|nr:UvrB/UvrC motif-containing protein [Clostridia bacterium]
MYKCQNCSKPATYFLKTNINGNINMVALCSECAAKENINSSDHSGMHSLFNPFFFGTSASVPQIKKCSSCGTKFSEICENSKYGCGECYNIFRKESEQYLRKINGGFSHVGKRPKSIPVKVSDRLEELRSLLAQAVVTEDYEKAAELRDKIKEIKSQKEDI